MKRRHFIKNTCLGISGLAFGNMALGGIAQTFTDLVTVSGGPMAEMYNKGILGLGGIEAFVLKGARVVVKPKMLTNSTPENHQNTNPALIKTIIDQCYEAGAKIVSVFEHTNDVWTKCYKNSGIERVAKDAWARVLPANEEFYYAEIQNTKASVLKKVKIHQALLECDVLINLSVFQPDAKTKVSGGIKNLMGCVWDKNSYQENGIESCLAEFLYYNKPQLNISEVYNEGRPPELMLSGDIVAIDSYAAKKTGIGLDALNHVTMAGQLGFGSSNVAGLPIKELQL